MLKVKLLLLGACLGFFAACGSSPSPASSNSGASPAEAQAAALAALNRMDGLEGGQPPATNPPAGNNPASAPAAQQETPVNTSRNQPAWVNSVDSVYNRTQYLAAAGYAADRTMAERNALANLTAIFGQSIQADQTITNTYQEAVRNGVTAGWTDNIAMRNTITTSASMDTLIGAEIKDVWLDSRTSVYYAVAVMEKAKTTQVYTEMIQANLNVITNLLAMSQSEKNSLEGFSRYQFAATIADINTSYENVLRVIGAPIPAGLVSSNTYRIEAQNITRVIPVGIRVANDKAGRIQGAFAKALSDLGFRSGGSGDRYILDVNIVVSPVEFPGNTNKFARIELDARFTDNGITLQPYNFNNREGHSTFSEAENRAYVVAERKINDEYSKLLGDYLSRLLPKR